jgi:transposase InsO family protein
MRACVLIVLYAAVEQFGAPQCLITDNGGVFRAKQLLAICEALEIEKEHIRPRQSWENLVETHFNVMRRMSQVHYKQVTSWQGAKLAPRIRTSKETAKKANAAATTTAGRPTSSSGVIRAPFGPRDDARAESVSRFCR